MVRNPEVLRDSPPEQRKGVKGFLSRHKGKILLALGLAAGTYGLGAAAQYGAFQSGGFIARNAPELVTRGLRNVSAQATRFTHIVDGGLQRLNIPGIQVPTDANSARQIRENIIEGTGPTRPHEIS